MKKRILSIILAIATVFIMAIPASASDINLVIDGTRVTNQAVAPVVEDGRTLVPLRLISETLGADVSWNPSRREATIETAAYTVVFTIGSTSYTVNGARKTLDVAPKIVNETTMIPMAAFADSIGAKVNYVASTHTATIDYFTTMTGTLKINGSTTVQPIAQAAADKLVSMNRGLSITVDGGGSGTGIKDAASGTVNIGMSSRELTADEKKDLNVYTVANDGIAIIVHPSNAVQNLTKDQAAKIFLGEIRNWNEVGGANAPILVTTRETGSGTRATFEEMLLNKESVAGSAQPFTSSALILQGVARERNAIGYDSIGFLDSTVKAVNLDGTVASAANVIANRYGLGRQLYVCTSGRATGLSAIFIDYLRSVDCQDNIVIKEGYVKIN